MTLIMKMLKNISESLIGSLMRLGKKEVSSFTVLQGNQELLLLSWLI
jgi:hypothetical protein